MNQTKSKKYGLTITILFISMLQMGGMGLSPSLASISAEMPEVPVSIVQTLTSFPSLVMIFVCLLANKLVFKFGKKLILLVGAACISAVGLLGYLFSSSIVLLYIWAALLGVGFGTVLPTTSGVLAENYEGKARSTLMGVQSVFTNRRHVPHLCGRLGCRSALAPELPGLPLRPHSRDPGHYLSSQ